MEDENFGDIFLREMNKSPTGMNMVSRTILLGWNDLTLVQVVSSVYR